MTLHAEHPYRIGISVTIDDKQGRAGRLDLRAYSDDVNLTPGEMAELIVQASKMLDQLVGEYQ